MADRNRSSGSRNSSRQEGGMSGSSSGRGEPMHGSSGRGDSMRGSGSDRSSSNIGRGRGSTGGSTSGSREESMQGLRGEMGGRDEDMLRGSQTRGRERSLHKGQVSDPSQSGLGGSSRATEGGSVRGAYGSENLTEDDLAAGGRPASGSRSTSGSAGSKSTGGSNMGQVGQLGDESLSGLNSGAMRGSKSGTTGLGGERNQTSTGSPGGVEGVTDKSNPTPDEDRSRNR